MIGPLEKWLMLSETQELLARLDKEERDAILDLGHFSRNWKLAEAPARCSHADGRRTATESIRNWITSRVAAERAALQADAASTISNRTPLMRTVDASRSNTSSTPRRAR